MIGKKYDNVQINIATSGFDSSCFEYWNNKDLPIRTLQLPYYSCDLEKLSYIIKNLPKNYSLIENIRKTIKCKNSHSICRVKVNFVVIKGINDSDEDIDKMINYLLEFKDDVIIKVSFLNYTKKCYENNLFSPNYKNMLKILNKQGLNATYLELNIILNWDVDNQFKIIFPKMVFNKIV